MNRKQATIAGLIALGFQEDANRSSKYRCFDEPVPVGVPFTTYLVGKSGALRRCGPGLNRLDKSASLTDSRYHAAFAYVGEVATRQPGLTQQQLSGIYRDVVDGKIVPSNQES